MNEISKYINFLKIHPPFNRMPADMLEKTASLLSAHHYGVGQTIFRRGEEADFFYIINTGVVREVTGGAGEILLSVLKSGECPGVASILSGERRLVDAVVEEDVELYVIYKDNLYRLFSDNPGLILHFNRILSQKLTFFFDFLNREGVELVDKTRSAAEKERELNLLDDITKLFNATGDMESRLSSVVTLMRDSLNTDACSIYTLDPLSDQLFLQAASGLDIPENIVVALRLSEGVTGWVVKNREPVSLEDAALDSRIKYLSEIHEERFHSLLSVPLVSAGECLGAINFQTILPRKYTYEEIRGTVIAGAQIASAYYSSLLKKRVSEELDTLKDEKRALPGDFRGNSPFIKKINKFIKSASKSDKSVLIEGEDGTGKELLARLIHSNGARSDGPFIEVDCSFFPSETWGDELFGTEKESGAFPDNKRSGFVEMADRGVLFLKFVEKLNSACQIKLFNFIESGLFNRVGSKVMHRANVRVIATTTMDLNSLVLAGSFSPSAFSLFSSFTFKTAPLRKMKREIPDLSSYLLKKIARNRHREELSLSEAAEKKLQSYDWPGNITELENALNGAAILTSGSKIEPENLFFSSTSPGDKPVFRIFKIAWVNEFFKTGLYPLFFGTIGLAIFSMTLLTLFLFQDNNLLNSALWSGGWFFIFLSLFFAGRVFCAVCPFITTGEIMGKFFKRRGLKPGPITRHGELFSLSFIFAIFFLEGVLKLHEQPAYTGTLLLLVTTGAVICSVFFVRRVWCRYLCPLGSLLGVFSLTSIFSIGAKKNICIYRCGHHACYTGTKDGAPGCQLFLHPYGIESQQHCVLCMQCHKNCPYNSVSLNLQFPGTGIISVLNPSLPVALVSAGLAGILPVENGGFLSPQSSFFSGISYITGVSFLPLFTLTFIASAIFPALFMITIERLAGGHDFRKSIFRFTRFSYAALPMALIGHIAFYGKKTVAWIEHSLSAAGFGQVDFYSANFVLSILFIAMILAGAAGSIHSFFRISRNSPETLYTATAARYGYLALLAIYTLLYISSIF